jgi:hypothetical protein
MNEDLVANHRRLEARRWIEQCAKQAVARTQWPGEHIAVHCRVKRASHVDPHELFSGRADTRKISEQLLASALKLGLLLTCLCRGRLCRQLLLVLEAECNGAVLSKVALEELTLDCAHIATFVHVRARHVDKRAHINVAEMLCQRSNPPATLGCARALRACMVRTLHDKVIGEIASLTRPLAAVRPSL